VANPNLPEDPDFGRLADQLRTLREERGLTYEELAEATGLSRRGVISLERGERNGNVRSWYRLARALGVMPSELFSALD
jgi:transcriptional regulator with XRE-family HTH domain